MQKNYPKEVLINGRVRVCLELIKNIDLKGKVLVDVGCSFGWLEKEILKLTPKRIIGIDPEKNALSFARENVRKAEFIEGSAIDIPLPDAVADVVILYDVIEHVPKNKEFVVLTEISRILKKGGMLLFSTPNANFWSNLFDIAWYFGHRHYKVENMTKLLQNAGFKIIQKETRGGIWSSIYMLWFYIAKWILGKKLPRNVFLEKMDDKMYSEGSIATLFIVAEKN